MEQAMGPMPGAERRSALQEKILREQTMDGMQYRLVSFSPEPGDVCFAWLLLPKNISTPRPGILCLHQTVRCGKDEPAGLDGTSNLHYGLELARLGYVALCPDYPGYGQYRVDSYALGYQSTTMKGIWNHRRSLDLLSALPEVAPGGFGCVGHSLGGHNALFLAAFDQRVRVVVCSCGFTAFSHSDNEGKSRPGDLSDWSHPGYMPRIATAYGNRHENMPFDFPDVLAAIAPRPIFVNAPQHDIMNFAGVKKCLELASPLYAAEKTSDLLVARHPGCAHDFPAKVRREAWAFLNRFLPL